MAILLTIMMTLILLWVFIGLGYFIYIDRQATKLYKRLIQFSEQEKIEKDMNKAVRFFLPKIELENNNADLIDLVKEKNKNPLRYYTSTVLKCILIGPLFLFF